MLSHIRVAHNFILRAPRQPVANTPRCPLRHYPLSLGPSGNYMSGNNCYPYSTCRAGQVSCPYPTLSIPGLFSSLCAPMSTCSINRPLARQLLMFDAPVVLVSRPSACHHPFVFGIFTTKALSTDLCLPFSLRWGLFTSWHIPGCQHDHQRFLQVLRGRLLPGSHRPNFVSCARPFPLDQPNLHPTLSSLFFVPWLNRHSQVQSLRCQQISGHFRQRVVSLDEPPHLPDFPSLPDF